MKRTRELDQLNESLAKCFRYGTDSDPMPALVPDCWRAIATWLTVPERITLSSVCSETRRDLLPLHEFYRPFQFDPEKGWWLERFVNQQPDTWVGVLSVTFVGLRSLDIRSSILSRQRPELVQQLFKWIGSHTRLTDLALTDGWELARDAGHAFTIFGPPIPSLTKLTLCFSRSQLRNDYLLPYVGYFYPALTELFLIGMGERSGENYELRGSVYRLLSNWPLPVHAVIVFSNSWETVKTISVARVQGIENPATPGGCTLTCIACGTTMTVSRMDVQSQLECHRLHPLILKDPGC